MHLILDTVTGGIAWLYPFSDGLFVLLRPIRRFDWWVWNFVCHWTFSFEIGIAVWAVILCATQSNTKTLPILLRRASWRPERDRPHVADS